MASHMDEADVWLHVMWVSWPQKTEYTAICKAIWEPRDAFGAVAQLPTSPAVRQYQAVPALTTLCTCWSQVSF